LVTVNAAPGTEETITLDKNTAIIEVNSVGGLSYLKYDGTATTAVYDEVILAGQTKHFRAEDSTTISVIGDGSVTYLSVIERLSE
jgi:hypothetical protein